MSKKYVYLMRLGQHYKIGWSRNPAKRQKDLTQVKSPDIVHLIESAIALRVESLLHHRFANRRVRGEWFLLQEADIALIRSLNRCDSDDDLPEWLLPTPRTMSVPESLTPNVDADPYVLAFARRLCELLDSDDRTHQEIAALVGVTPKQLRLYVLARQSPRYRTVCCLADTFGVTISEFAKIE